MAATEAARRNTTVHVHDCYFPNDPFQDPCIGRRTGIPLNIRARKDSNGFDNIDDYFPDSDSEEENAVPNQQNPDKEVLVGRRTGIPLDINARRDSQGFELVDDYFPDSGCEKSEGTSLERGQTDEPTEQSEQMENLLQHTSRRESEELEMAETPGVTVESPNDTGTVMKNTASCEPTPQLKGPIKKRLSFAPGKSPTEAEPSMQSQLRVLLDDMQVIDKNDDESDSDIDVVSVEDNTRADCQGSFDVLPSTTLQATSKAGRQETASKKTKTSQGTVSSDDDEVIDVEGVEDEDTFLTIGNTTRNERSNAVNKSPVSAEGDSVFLNESFVLKGTKHKTMSPEYGSLSDSQPEPNNQPALREKKSKIPVRTKGLPIGTKQKDVKGKKAIMEERRDFVGKRENVNKGSGLPQGDVKSFTGRLQVERPRKGRQRRAVERQIERPEVEAVVDDRDEEEEDVDVVGEDSKTIRGRAQNEMKKSTRGRRKEVDEGQNAEPIAVTSKDVENELGDDHAEVIEAMANSRQSKNEQGVDEQGPIDSDAVTGKRRKRKTKSSPGTKQQPQKLATKAKKNGKTVFAESGVDVLVDGEKKGRKKQGNEENLQCKDDDGGGEDFSGEGKSSNLLTTAKTRTDMKKAPQQGRRAEKGSDHTGTNTDQEELAEVSGRKTRAQRKREADAKINKEDGIRKDKDIKTRSGDGVDAELSGAKTRAHRKKEADAKLNNEHGKTEDKEVEDAELSERKTRVQRKKADVQLKRKAGKGNDSGEGNKDGNDRRYKETGQTEGQDMKASKEIIRERTDIGPEDVLDDMEEMDEEQMFSDKTLQQSVSNSFKVSSNGSSGSESGKRTGTKRRKRSLVLPSYTRRTNKSKSSKMSLNIQDSATEPELRIDAKKPRLEAEQKQSNTAGEESKKRDTISFSQNVRAVRTGRKPTGGKKRASQRSKTNETDISHHQSAFEQQSRDQSVFESPYDVGDGNATTSTDDTDEVKSGNNTDYSVREAGTVEDRSFEEIALENLTPKPFAVPSAKSGTALKSILKSGGSSGRGNAASRKRRKMNSDKSHSGGSDADDESMQPTKQPNSKRLSTVSFAATPYVHSSPADDSLFEAAKVSPLAGLSFVSKGSSNYYSDGSFTPGSGLSRRSSAGSGSGGSLSVGESDIDPEDEVTLTKDDKLSEGSSDEKGQRRSKRTIVPPLQFWKNERIDYERRQSGGWCIKGVIKNPTPTPKIRKKTKAKKPATRKQGAANAQDSSEEEVDNEELQGFEPITNPTGTVFNPETNEEVEMDLFHAPGMLNFTNPVGKPATDDDPLVVHKFITQPLFGGGQLILKPGAEKGRQFVRNDTMVFYVIKGKIIVTIHQSSVVLNTGSTFFVPQGNSYKIKNLKQTEAKLMFVQIKG